eukprot:3931787-Rhodomonas_salina.3
MGGCAEKFLRLIAPRKLAPPNTTSRPDMAQRAHTGIGIGTWRSAPGDWVEGDECSVLLPHCRVCIRAERTKKNGSHSDKCASHASNPFSICQQSFPSLKALDNGVV